MALYNVIDPTKPGKKPEPGKIMPQTDSIVKGINTLTDEYMYKGLSEAEVKRFKRVNENLKSKGEIYDPQSRKIYKTANMQGGSGNLVPMENVFQAFRHNYGGATKYPDPELLPGLLRANGLYMDPKSGDVFPIR